MEIFQEIFKALDTIYSPSSSNEQRRIAQEFCERLKVDPKAPIYGHHLAHVSQNFPETVRFFGFNLLEHAIRYRWVDDFTPTERVKIKELVVDLFSDGLSMSEKPYIRDKCARIFSELAEREWPQNWPKLELLLYQAFSKSRSHQMLVLSVLQNIADDCFLYPNPITTKRKEDLRNSLIAIISPAYLDSSVPSEYYALVGVGQGNDGWLARIIAILHETISSVNHQLSDEMVPFITMCIKNINSFIDWIPFDILQKSSVVSILVSFLNQDAIQIRNSACEGLETVVLRGFSDMQQAEEVLMIPLLSPEALEIVASSWHKSGGSLNIRNVDDHLETDYSFLKALAHLYSDLGLVHITHKKAAHVPASFEKYLEFLLVLTAHQSLTISSSALQVWIALQRHELTSNSEALTIMSKSLFEVLVQKVDKSLFLPSDDEDSQISSRYSMHDFGQGNDFQVAFGAYRNQIYSVLKPIVEKNSALALQVCSTMFQQLQALPVPDANDTSRNKKGLLTTLSPYYLHWDSFTSVLSCITGSLNKQLTTDLNEILLPMIQSLLQTELADPLIIGRQLDCLSYFSVLLSEEYSQIAFQILQKIFNFITFTLPHEPKVVDENWDVSEDTFSLRRKACASLLRLAIAQANLLMSIYGQLKVEINRLIQGKLLSFPEKASFLEFEVAIIFNASSVNLDTKKQMFGSLYLEMIPTAITQQLTSILESNENFFEACAIKALSLFVNEKRKSGNYTNALAICISQSDSCHRQLIVGKQLKSWMQYSVTSYKLCLARSVRTMSKSSNDVSRIVVMSISPWACNLHVFVPYFLSMIKHLHSLWDEQNWDIRGDCPALLTKDLLTVLDLTPIEKSIIMGGTSGTEVAETEQESSSHSPVTVGDWLTNFQSWLRYFRENCYSMVGQCTYLDEYFYSIPNLAELMLQNIFGSVTSMTNYHWRTLIHFVVKPLIVNCPQKYYQDFLAKILPPLLSFIGQKLDAEWKTLIATGNLIGTFEEAEASSHLADEKQEITASENEILHQKSLRDLTRVWTDIIISIFLNGKDPGEKKSKGDSKFAVSNRPAPDFGSCSNLVSFLMSNQAVAEPLLYSIVASLNWKDTRACTSSARALSKIVPILASNPQFHSFLAQNMLPASVQALHDGYHQEGHDFIVILITDIYVLTRPHSNLPQISVLSMIPNIDIEVFEKKLSEEHSLSGQRRIVKEYFKSVIGMKPAQWFSETSKTHLRGLPEKILVKLAKSHDQTSFSLDERHGTGLLELFQ